jgi:ribosome maturation factor RimP
VHFQNAVGEKVKFKLGDGNKLKGTLKSADNKSVTVETKAGEETYEYSDLNTCKTYFEW